jgi:DNA-binding PadR family transcriptional regulator
LGSISLKSGLVQKPDRKKSFYEITDKGRGYLENPPEEVEGEELERTTEKNHRGYDRRNDRRNHRDDPLRV